MRTNITVFFILFTSIMLGQQVKDVDFKQAKAYIFEIDPIEKQLKGRVSFQFDVLTDVDSVFLDARNFSNVEVELNGNDVKKHINTGKKIIIKERFKANTTHSLNIYYAAKPSKAMYFVGWDNAAPDQIWTQGQGKNTSNWLPSIDDMNEKMEFDLSISFKNGYQVVANGKLIEKQIGPYNTVWHYDMKHPMSSYLVAIAIGTYKKNVVHSNSGIPIELYYYPEDSLRVEPTYRYSKSMFDFLEKEIGESYPWQDYKQVPVHDFLYAGMENTSLTLFSDSYVVDSTSFKDFNYVNVNAHELAHQWFGNMVTASSGTHHWLQEGFATYYALLVERKAFGDDYFHWQLFKSAQQLNAQDMMGQGTSLLNPNSSSLTFYQKGAWTLYMLRELVGDVPFKKAIKAYLSLYSYQNVTTAEFIKQVEIASGMDLTEFTKVWLESDAFPFDRAIAALKQNSFFINEYLMVDCELISSKCKDYLSSGISDKAKAKIIQQNSKEIKAEHFNSSWEVRQAIASNLKEIPRSLKSEYESLLEDQSYITIENALFNLWNNFPEDRIEYLEKTKEIIGMKNKNVRLLWLFLAKLTPSYESEVAEDFIKEFQSYTSEENNFEVRISAFQFLQILQSCDEACQNNLLKASKHHNWQLVKFAKEMIESYKN